MGASFTPELVRLLRNADCRFMRHGKGDHGIWFPSISGLHFPVDKTIKSRHTANAVLRQAGLHKWFRAFALVDAMKTSLGAN